MGSNDTALVVRAAAVARIDEIAAKAPDLFRQSGFETELAIAQSIGDLRAALTPEVMKPIMALQNSDLGFRTDKPNGPGYDVDVVRECFIEAKMRGFRAIGNEFNILAGRFYAAKNGLRRKVQTWPGLTDLRDSYDPPRLAGDRGAIVECRASWKINGTADSVEAKIPIRVNSAMGADAILGKAQRKLLARIHDRLGGISTPDGEAGDVDAIEIVPQITAPPRPTTAPPNGRAPSGEQAAPAGAVPSQTPAGAEPDRGPDELRDFGAGVVSETPMSKRLDPWPPEGTRQPEPGEAGTDAHPPAEPFDPADAAMQKVIRAKSFAEQRAVRPEFEGAIRDLPPAERDAMWQTYVDKLLKWIPVAPVTDMGPLATEVRELRKMKLIGDEKYTPALEAFKKREAARTGVGSAA